jgi:hypothetical protein
MTEQEANPNGEDGCEDCEFTGKHRIWEPCGYCGLGGSNHE